MELCLMERHYNRTRRGRGNRRFKQTVGLGKFAACLLQPFANLHYILAPAGIVKKTDVPARWGLLSYGPGGISVVVKATWQEMSAGSFVECAIAKTLTGEIYRAGDRAISSVNRELMKQQQQLADKIRQLRPFAPSPIPSELFVDRQAAAVEQEAPQDAGA
jgi:hypothetical protein